MKKLLSLLILTFSLSFVSAQTFNKVTECRLEVYNGSEWVVKERNFPEKMFVIIKDKNVKITNSDESEYEVYGDADFSKYESHYAYVWSAVSKDAKNCRLLIKTSKENNTILEVAILFDGVCYAYSFVKK